MDTDRVINECLDLEATGHVTEARELLRRAAASDPTVVPRFKELRAVLADLTVGVRAPDLSRRILRDANRRRPFLTKRRRRKVSAVRVALAAGVLMALTLVAVMQRLFPESATLAARPAPVTEVVEASRVELADSMRSLANVVGTLREGLTAPVTGVVGPDARPRSSVRLTLGDTARYESPTWSTSMSVTGGGARFAGGPFAMPNFPTVSSAAPSLLGSTTLLDGVRPSATLLPQPPISTRLLAGECVCGGTCAGRGLWSGLGSTSCPCAIAGSSGVSCPCCARSGGK